MKSELQEIYRILRKSSTLRDIYLEAALEMGEEVYMVALRDVEEAMKD